MKYLLVVLLLSSCATEGTKYVDTKDTVIYRPIHLGNVRSGSTVSVNINGAPKCDLHVGSYFTLPRGQYEITASKWSTPGTSHIKSNHQYIRMDIDPMKTWGTGLFGLIGMVGTESISDNSGSFIFTEVDSETARKELTNLTQDCK